MSNIPVIRQQWIYDELVQKGSVTYSETFGRYSEMFGKSDKTFDKDWKKANEAYLAYKEKANKAKEDASIAEEVDAFKSGLKSKFERQLELQSMLLPDYTVEEKTPNLKTGDIITWNRKLQPKEIIMINAELSKMAGEYAPVKTEVTGKDGSPIKIEQTETIDYTKLSEEEVDQLITLYAKATKD